MTIQNVVQNVSSGGNTIGHVVTDATLGDGLLSIMVWGLQTAHLDPPAAAGRVALLTALRLLEGKPVARLTQFGAPRNVMGQMRAIPDCAPF